MSELEESCIRLIRYSQQNLEKTVGCLDLKTFDHLISEYAKLESTLLQTSNNLNKCQLEGMDSNEKLKQLIAAMQKS